MGSFIAGRSRPRPLKARNRSRTAQSHGPPHTSVAGTLGWAALPELSTQLLRGVIQRGPASAAAVALDGPSEQTRLQLMLPQWLGNRKITAAPGVDRSGKADTRAAPVGWPLV